jgi:hypothetical protein
LVVGKAVLAATVPVQAVVVVVALGDMQVTVVMVVFPQAIRGLRVQVVAVVVVVAVVHHLEAVLVEASDLQDKVVMVLLALLPVVSTTLIAAARLLAEHNLFC